MSSLIPVPSARLVEIRHIGILPQLVERILIPSVVYDELRHPSAPAAVRTWANSRPSWLEVLPVTVSDDPAFHALDDGEKSALTLGMALGAELILIDDRCAYPPQANELPLPSTTVR